VGQRTLPRLERALDRTRGLTTEVLAYGKSAEPKPQARVRTNTLPKSSPLTGLDAGLEPKTA